MLSKPAPALDPRTWDHAARHWDNENFTPFHNPKHEKCFFCNSACLAVSPLFVEDQYMIIPATLSIGPGLLVTMLFAVVNQFLRLVRLKSILPKKELRVVPWAYLIVPLGVHATCLSELPKDWAAYQAEAVAYLEELGFRVDNLTLNLTPEGGKTAAHLHWWVIQRPEGTELGGIATLLVRLRYRILQSALRLAA